MNISTKAGVAGALALAGIAAHASIAQPSSGASDAILFAEVVNAAGTKAVASYAGDTGLTINQLTSGITASTTVLGSDSNLSALFAADAAGDKVLFSVQAGQYVNGALDPGTYLTTVNANLTSKLSNVNTLVLVNSFQSIDVDVATINSNLSNSPSSVEGASPPSAGVWDITNTSGLAYWDGGQVATANAADGTPDSLYKVVAGNASSNTAPAKYSLLGTASLTSAGLVLAAAGGGGTTPPVPLPAAVWLLGSGLLGLTGVARRKAKA
jgi:hypothetical protein